MHKKSVAQLERHYEVQDMNITLREWTQLTRVPDCVISLMHIPEKLLWGAMQLHDNSIGDIYLIQYSKGEVENLLWFAPTEDNSYTLRFNGNADPSWGDWRTDIIPLLRPVNISAVSGYPVLIGWASEEVGLDQLLVPGSEKTLEQTIAAGFYSNPQKPHRKPHICFYTCKNT